MVNKTKSNALGKEKQRSWERKAALLGKKKQRSWERKSNALEKEKATVLGKKKQRSWERKATVLGEKKMDIFIDRIFVWLSEALPDVRIAVLLIAMLPIVEARLAIPIALRSGLSPASACLYGFLGSSLMAPILLLSFLPLVGLISRLKPFSKAGDYVLERFSQKATKLSDAGARAYLGVFLFAALPLPLTGVWTSSAIAAILKLKLPKATLAIAGGNLIASLILTLLCYFLKSHLNTIILIITLIAILAVLTLIAKILLKKGTPRKPSIE